MEIDQLVTFLILIRICLGMIYLVIFMSRHTRKVFHVLEWFVNHGHYGKIGERWLIKQLFVGENKCMVL